MESRERENLRLRRCEVTGSDGWFMFRARRRAHDERVRARVLTLVEVLERGRL